MTWKQSLVVPALKPGKDPSDPSSYRSIAFIPQLGVGACHNHSGSHEGRNTMDPILCLELQRQESSDKWGGGSNCLFLY